MIDDVISCKDTVEEIIAVDQRARDDDKWLIYRVYKEYGVEIPYEKLKTLPAFESITRCRRKLQEVGQYPASVEVQQGRADEEQGMREMMSE